MNNLDHDTRDDQIDAQRRYIDRLEYERASLLMQIGILQALNRRGYRLDELEAPEFAQLH